MTITLRPEHEQLITQALRSGAYQNPEDVIARALEILHSEAAWLLENKETIHGKIERAFEQFERGEFLTAEESRADMENRKSAWLADHNRG